MDHYPLPSCDVFVCEFGLGFDHVVYQPVDNNEDTLAKKGDRNLNSRSVSCEENDNYIEDDVVGSTKIIVGRNSKNVFIKDVFQHQEDDRGKEFHRMPIELWCLQRKIRCSLVLLLRFLLKEALVVENLPIIIKMFKAPSVVSHLTSLSSLLFICFLFLFCLVA
ncbi:hypothetical protein NE237_004296 [Protea cynaroides]|uniref:Uncharacterized protein n=1 Tax=Protea cynaroides TaxID=273540 RepID=A0A9Q0KII5_9MAGN|nr:hypothetical protein NE237_004296 [Protea cynaroides]